MSDQSDTHIPEVLGSQAMQDLSIDRVVAKCRRILFEAQPRSQSGTSSDIVSAPLVVTSVERKLCRQNGFSQYALAV